MLWIVLIGSIFLLRRVYLNVVYKSVALDLRKKNQKWRPTEEDGDDRVPSRYIILVSIDSIGY